MLLPLLQWARARKVSQSATLYDCSTSLLRQILKHHHLTSNCQVAACSSCGSECDDVTTGKSAGFDGRRSLSNFSVDGCGRGMRQKNLGKGVASDVVGKFAARTRRAERPTVDVFFVYREKWKE